MPGPDRAAAHRGGGVGCGFRGAQPLGMPSLAALPFFCATELGCQRVAQGFQSLAERTGLRGGNDQLVSSSR